MALRPDRAYNDGSYNAGTYNGIGLSEIPEDVGPGGLVATYLTNPVEDFPYTVLNDYDVILHVKNGGGVTCTLSFPVAGTTVVLPAGAERFLADFLPSRYNDRTSGNSRLLRFQVDRSAGVEIAVLRVR